LKFLVALALVAITLTATVYATAAPEAGQSLRNQVILLRIKVRTLECQRDATWRQVFALTLQERFHDYDAGPVPLVSKDPPGCV